MPVLAGVYNIIADQGATFTRAFIKKDHEKRVIPLTGNYLARMQVRETYESPSTILNLNTENDYITIDGPRGVISVVVSDDETRLLIPGEYVYDLELVYPDEQVERMLMGTFTVRKEVTR